MTTDRTTGIRSIRFRRDDRGVFRCVRIAFAPDHRVELQADADGNVEFWLGATHHGIRADASTVTSELERITTRIRDEFPENVPDHVPLWDGGSV